MPTRAEIGEANERKHDKDIYMSKIAAILAQFLEELH
jgi:hypothetical protein